MTPSAQQRLDTMIVAMRKIVLPALEDSTGLAKEQAGLILGHLHILRDQIAFNSRFEEIELRSVVKMARSLTASGGPATLKASTALGAAIELADAVQAGGEVAAATEAVNRAVSDLLTACRTDGDPGTWQACARHVLAFATLRAPVDRAWFKGSGFEPDPASLPDIPTLMAELESTTDRF